MLSKVFVETWVHISVVLLELCTKSTIQKAVVRLCGMYTKFRKRPIHTLSPKSSVSPDFLYFKYFPKKLLAVQKPSNTMINPPCFVFWGYPAKTG